uniref:oocyte-secreted protein 4A-like n=1 Tax=Jaculus jaculus TaxID=51337 RepID=UPI001E1B05A9|nr:oocyte-secreted protein 4A-like [Jaculus jaculus]
MISQEHLRKFRSCREMVILERCQEPCQLLAQVSITCSEQWLQVKVKQRPYLDNQQIQPYELYLGTGCPVTGGLLDYYEFFYPLSSCGITAEVRMWGILIESSITYEPVNLDIRGYLPISCYIQRKFTFTYFSKVKGNNKNCASNQSTSQEKSTSNQVENQKTQNSVPPCGPHAIPSRLSIGLEL